jgi:hypothetical protein
MTQATTPQGSDQVRWASGLNIVAGLWLIISPFVLAYSGMQNALWNDVIIGIAVAALAAIRAGGWINQAWLSWVNLVLGAWVLVSPWVLGFTGDQTALWNNVITGAIVLILGGWSALATGNGAGGVPIR